MNRDERRRMLENKQAFVEAIGQVLARLDGNRSNVIGAELDIAPSLLPDAFEERILIRFASGGVVLIPATGNSNLANMLAIGRALL